MPQSPRKMPIVTSAKTSGTQKFAFESVSYEANAAGGLLELSGRGIADSRVRLFEGIQEIGEVVANSKGIWTFSKRGKVKPGPHMFKAAHVLKSGRIASETRMQYDHVDVIGDARNNKVATAKPMVMGGPKKDKRAKNKSAETNPTDTTKMANGQMASPDARAPNGEGADHSVPRGSPKSPAGAGSQSGPCCASFDTALENEKSTNATRASRKKNAPESVTARCQKAPRCTLLSLA